MDRKLHRIIGIVLFVFCAQIIFTQEPFTISTSYKNLLSNPEQEGLLDRLMAEVFDRLGREAEIVFTPTEKSLVDVNAGLLDAELNRIEGMEAQFPDLVRVPESNMVMHFVAFSKREIPLTNWECLEELYIGLVKGWKILEWNTEGCRHRTLTPTETELFTMLALDRLDLALYSKLTGYAALREMGLEGIRHLEPPLASREMYLYVHKKHSDLIDDIAAALREIKGDGTYDVIQSEVLQKYGIPVE